MPTIPLISKMNQLTQSLLEHEDIDILIKDLNWICNKTVIVLDSMNKVTSFFFEDPDYFSIEQIQDVQLSTHPLFPNKIYKCSITTEKQQFSGMSYPIEIQNKLQGFLFVNDLLKPQEEQTALFQHCCQLIALHLQKTNAIREEKINQKEAFLFDLLYGNIKSEDDIQVYGDIFGWDFTLTYVAIVFSINKFDFYSDDRENLDKIYSLIESALLQRKITPIILKKRSEVIVLFSLMEIDRKKDKDLIKTFAFNIKQQCKRLYPAKDFMIGVGRPYSNPTDLFRSYQQAKVALELGNLLDHNQEIPFFMDLGLPRLLYNLDTLDLREFYEETLGDLIKYDEENSSDLLGTLEQYLLNECDIQIAADSLYLHKNTLRYRLKKIESILQIELDNLLKKFHLLIAFKIKRMKNF